MLPGITVIPTGMCNGNDFILLLQKIEDILFLIQGLVQRIIQPQYFFCPDTDLVFFTHSETMFISRDIEIGILIERTDLLVI